VPEIFARTDRCSARPADDRARLTGLTPVAVPAFTGLIKLAGGPMTLREIAAQDRGQAAPG
jgi:hypothetical protein